MRSYRGMMLAVMLAFSLGALGICPVLQSSVTDGGLISPANQFELAYTHHDAIWIQSNQDMIDQADDESWPGDGSAENPFIITGFSFDSDTQPLRIWNTDLYWVFTGNLVDSDLTDQQCGTWLDGVENGVITDNIFRHRHAGMYILNVENVNITNNEIYDNLGYGMEFGGWIQRCNVSGNTIYDCPNGAIRVPAGTFNSTIIGNTIYDCTGGITLLGSVQKSIISHNQIDEVTATGIAIAMARDSTVSFNTVTNATDNGIQITGSTNSLVANNTIISSDEDGIATSYLDESTIEYNSIVDCSEVGIKVVSGENSTIQWNTVEGCTGYALELAANAESMKVNYNTFIDNSVACQIYDDGTTNDISFNYYSDWTSPDNDANGIVDSPYSVHGDVENADPYPLTVAGVIPEIETPTTTPETPAPIPMELVVLGAGAVLAIIIVAGVVLKKR